MEKKPIERGKSKEGLHTAVFMVSNEEVLNLDVAIKLEVATCNICSEGQADSWQGGEC